MSKVTTELIKRLRNIDTVKEYDTFLIELNQKLIEEGYPRDFCQEIKQKQKYIKNSFSDEINKEKMLVSKEKLLECFEEFGDKEVRNNDNEYLIQYLSNFYMFMEVMREREPDKRATLTNNVLRQIKIENEYDLQHLLYAVLKPLYPDIRKEVAEDSGVGMVRGDLKIPSLNSVVETKCTREKMNLKKLTEEIEADIVHYQETHIVFFVYDKAKIINEKQNYEDFFSRTFDGKDVKIIIQQPINL